MSNDKLGATRYPIPTPERREIVRRLGNLAAELDAEVRSRTIQAEADSRHDLGSWNAMVADELARAAGTVRFMATLVIQGNMSLAKARFATACTVAYIKLVRRADNRGVIQ